MSQTAKNNIFSGLPAEKCHVCWTNDSPVISWAVYHINPTQHQQSKTSAMTWTLIRCAVELGQKLISYFAGTSMVEKWGGISQAYKVFLSIWIMCLNITWLLLYEIHVCSFCKSYTMNVSEKTENVQWNFSPGNFFFYCGWLILIHVHLLITQCCFYSFRAHKTVTVEDLRFPMIMGEGRRARLLATIGLTRGLGDHNLKVFDSAIRIKPFLSCIPAVSLWFSLSGRSHGMLREMKHGFLIMDSGDPDNETQINNNNRRWDNVVRSDFAQLFHLCDIFWYTYIFPALWNNAGKRPFCSRYCYLSNEQ